MAYIVVSDVHLGSKVYDRYNRDMFCGFLNWVRGLENKEETIKCGTKEVTIQKPENLILLGDILELWDPKDGDRDNVIKDSIIPFSILSDINCDKTYVIGNHDDSLGELEDDVNNVVLPNGKKFTIYDRHYPEKKADTATGIPIGKKSYFFLHGHQFDKEQAILAWVSGLIGESWNPLGWFQDLFNILDTKKHWMRNFLIFSLLFLAVGYLILSGILGTILGPIFNGIQNPVLTILKEIILFLLGAGALVGMIYLLWKKLYMLFLLLSVLILGGWYFKEQSSLWILIWGTLTGYFALGSIPGVVANTQRKFYNLFKSTDKTAEQIITDGYYKKDKDTMEADIVVFGHTHFASSYGPNPDTGNRLFINTGCFYGKDKKIDGKMRYANTFIYIDGGGAYIMRWQGQGKIECIEAFPTG
ncbi:MAG: metallophosphoesterase [Candidatus Methanoperedens sp.]|nr:metallophosphoesterase [Candidatus Methanoperedens sp.]